MSFWRMVAPWLILTLSVAAGQTPHGGQHGHSADYRAMQQKLARLKQNSERAHPDPRPVDLTEPEVNAYFNEGGVKLPRGVTGLHLTSRPAAIDGHAQVDFEQIMEGRGKSNPIYSLFSGSHDVHVLAQASGANGVGTIRAQTVELDGVAIPQWALEWFVEHYLTPKYSNVGMTSTFKLPLRIDSAVVEAGKVRLVQR